MESTSGENSPEKKKKRGVRNDDSYQRNTIKRCRVKGLEYVGYSGKRIEKKVVGPPCR